LKQPSDLLQNSGDVLDHPGPEQVLLVAGPGGSGKSTFLRLLASNELPPELRRCLPADAGKWPMLMPRILRKESGRSLLPARFALHYDIAGYAARAEVPYGEDAALRVLRSARRVAVVDIRPSASQLVSQAALRAAEEDRRRSWLGRLWRLSRLRQLLQTSEPLASGSPASKLELYRQPGWLEACYARWDAFLAASVSARPDIAVMRIEPELTRSGQRSFRLLPPPS
jgi:hypothetical protein